ncbi:MAG: hypothetical protein JXA46_15605 [Dehalococcoidales bacterium]|nr:hypothetical protein [Dehalococcoidales bacterium]
MMKIHGCKKCGGALVLDKDEFGWYEQCIQCGYTHDIPVDRPIRKPYMMDHMPDNGSDDAPDLVTMWKQDKIAAFKPIDITDNREED